MSRRLIWTVYPAHRRGTTELRCYFVSEVEFEDPNPAPGESDLKKISAKAFLEKVSAGRPTGARDPRMALTL